MKKRVSIIVAVTFVSVLVGVVLATKAPAAPDDSADHVASECDGHAGGKCTCSGDDREHADESCDKLDDHDRHNGEDEHAEHDEDERGDHDEDEHAEHDESEGHDEDEHAENDEHEGHDEDEHAEHDDHDDEGAQLGQEQMEQFDISIEKARSGDIEIQVSLPGEITFNGNKLAHIVPSAGGIVRQVVKDVGDSVEAGEVIAWLESTELGQAKVEYLTRQAEVSCCSIELTRAQEINDNTMKLLELLKSSPSLETLRKMNGSAMGMNRSLLISAYAEFIFTKETYVREKDLSEKKISSKEDFRKAQSEFKKTDAQYIATQDSVRFEVRRDLLEAKRTQYLSEIELKAAERILYVLGLTAEDVKALTALAKDQSLPTLEEEDECTDPNCKECVAKAKSKDQGESVTEFGITNEKLAWYPIRAPFDATIVDKHITLGEIVGDDTEVLVIADLSSVWVDLHVYQKDLMSIKKGQKVIISAGETIPDIEGVISYVGSVVGQESRTVLARVVLPNESGMLRPGLFVSAKVTIDDIDAGVIVPKDAVQNLNGRKCVFVKDQHGFEPSYVSLGRSDTDYVEVTSGLDPGQQYVTKGAFELKAKIITSTLDSHAGHGH